MVKYKYWLYTDNESIVESQITCKLENSLQIMKIISHINKK